ncbi:MAG: hypothetical protein ABFS86_13155 [Planctomycetota bacterium]
MSRTLVFPALAWILLPFLTACLSSPDPGEATVAAATVEPETLAETYTRHVRELTEEDIALGRIVVAIGESVSDADSAGTMMLRERTLERLVEQVRTLRDARLRVLDFWDRVRLQWPGMATMEERAALELLGERDDRVRPGPGE